MSLSYSSWSWASWDFVSASIFEKSPKTPSRTEMIPLVCSTCVGRAPSGWLFRQVHRFLNELPWLLCNLATLLVEIRENLNGIREGSLSCLCILDGQFILLL